jgi:hypothetical protein
MSKTKAKRLTLYLTEKSLDVIGPAENLSGRVNSIISHYGRLTTEATPELTLGEWSFLCDMLNGTFIEDNTGDYLWADIAESGKLDGLDEKWDVDAEAFSTKVRDMPHASRCTLLDVVFRFWKGRDEHSEGMAEMLQKAGAKIGEEL